MQFLRNLLDKLEPKFHKGGKLEKLYPLYEATDTFLFTPPDVTKSSSHVRDAIDLKRMMMTVVIALLPCVLFAMYNAGYQANLAISKMVASGVPLAQAHLDNWQSALFQMLGMGFDPTSILACLLHGAIYFLPVYAVTMLVGGHIEVLFAVVRKHEVNEGFLVTGLLFPLTLPPTIPLWQVALGISFGIILGKEVFGGTGMNVLNPALVSRAFLFFAYPAQISGDQPWIAANLTHKINGVSGATALADAAANTPKMMGSWNWLEAFIGRIPGSFGETSALCCLIGAAILILTRVGSWRTMFGVVLGTFAMAQLLNAFPSATNGMFALPFEWHIVVGGWAFGMVFMATDPVSSAFTEWGKLWYGFGIGVMVVLIRVINPAYPEGMMLAILFMNMFAPLIDHFIVQGNIKRRIAHYGVQ
jgi:Na+-transporting NADH:ubiquinone oxidoreductase subunit B